MNEQNLKISKSSIYKICLIILALLFAFATFMPFLTDYYGKTFCFLDWILNFFYSLIIYKKVSSSGILYFILYLVFILSILSMCVISFIKNARYLLNKEEKEDTLFLTIGIGLYLGAAFFACLKKGAIYLDIYNGNISSQSFTPFFGYMCVISIIYFILIKSKSYNLSFKNFDSKAFIKCSIESLCLIFAFVTITNVFNLNFGIRTLEESWTGEIIPSIGYKTISYFVNYLNSDAKSVPSNGKLLVFILSLVPFLLTANFVIQSLTSKKLFIAKICSNIVSIILVIVPFIIFAALKANDTTMVFITSSNIFLIIICLIPLILNILEKIFLDKNIK